MPRGSIKRLPEIRDTVLIRFRVILKVDKRQAIAEVKYNGQVTSKSINHLYPFEVEDDLF